VLNPDAEGNLGIVPEVLSAEKRGDAQGIIKGVVGEKLGFKWYMDQNIASGGYTPGTAWVTGYTVSSISVAAGDTTLNITNTTAAGSIKVGDIFTVGGSSQQYVVTVTATFSATVPMAISFKPALASAASAGVALTVIGTAYAANLAFHPNAFAWVSRPLGDIDGLGNNISAMTDPISGITLRVEAQRQNKQTLVEFDILGGAALIRDALAVKILG
jgi:hypothetical protein